MWNPRTCRRPADGRWTMFRDSWIPGFPFEKESDGIQLHEKEDARGESVKLNLNCFRISCHRGPEAPISDSSISSVHTASVSYGFVGFVQFSSGRPPARHLPLPLQPES